MPKPYSEEFRRNVSPWPANAKPLAPRHPCRHRPHDPVPGHQPVRGRTAQRMQPVGHLVENNHPHGDAAAAGSWHLRIRTRNRSTQHSCRVSWPVRVSSRTNTATSVRFAATGSIPWSSQTAETPLGRAHTRRSSAVLDPDRPIPATSLPCARVCRAPATFPPAPPFPSLSPSSVVILAEILSATAESLAVTSVDSPSGRQGSLQGPASTSSPIVLFFPTRGVQRQGAR